MNLVSNDTYSTFAYGYDALGRRTAKNDERYFHNVRGELVLATNVATGAEFAYRYDDIGNRIWSRELGTNCTYAANELNQYTDVVRGGVAEHLAFDPDGNQTNVVTGTGVWAVEYNGENRPVRWTRLSDGNSISMAYDRMGRRISKNGETFVYDGYLNVGNTVWDPTEPVATRPLVSCGDDGTVAYLFHDGNKNVVDEVWPEELKSVTYEPFGKCLELDYSRVTTPWRYSSEYDDSLLGLLYYNSRFLNSRIGRWNSGDAIGEMGGENLYCFCLNSPEDKTDSLGFQSNCTESELTTTLGWEFNVGFGSIAISYNNRLRQRDCRVCCPDGSMGQTITKEYSNGGGGGGSWKVLIGPIPIQIGFSYQVSGGSVEFSDSCSVSRTFNGCKTVSMSLFAGPSVSISGVGIAILGDLTISSTSCLGKDEIPQAISGKLVFQLCYWPGNCQTKDLYP